MMQLGRVKILLIILVVTLFVTAIYLPVSAQSSGTKILSGNSADSYVCPGDDPYDRKEIPKIDPNTGYFVCNDGQRATLIAPPLQQLEVWFKRIVYVIWSLVASFSFIMLVYLGYRYMLRGGTSDKELVKLRKDILNYILGFVLVFFAIPILTTFFNLIGINRAVDCYDVAMPGFQFFFTELCTDPKYILVNDPCNFRVSASGYACSQKNTQGPTCRLSANCRVFYRCTENLIWERVVEGLGCE